MGSADHWEAPARWTMRASACHVVRRDLVATVDGPPKRSAARRGGRTAIESACIQRDA